MDRATTGRLPAGGRYTIPVKTQPIKLLKKTNGKVDLKCVCVCVCVCVKQLEAYRPKLPQA
jgi:hypothetical protein